jgi:hypothetical protein
MVQVNMEQGSAALGNTLAQGALHNLEVVKLFGFPEIQNQVRTRKLDPVSFNEMVGRFAGKNVTMVLRPWRIACCR